MEALWQFQASEQFQRSFLYWLDFSLQHAQNIQLVVSAFQLNSGKTLNTLELWAWKLFSKHGGCLEYIDYL